MTRRTCIAGLERGAKPAEALALRLKPLQIGHIVCEIPRAYFGKGKGDQNDLIDLAYAAGTYTGTLAVTYRVGEVLAVTPATWKGGVPKEIHQARFQRRAPTFVINAIDTADCPASLKHNVIDAVAIAWWAAENRFSDTGGAILALDPGVHSLAWALLR